MTANNWLRISIPIQGLLILSQLITGLNAEHIPPNVYAIVHVGGGLTLGLLVIVHVTLNWDWIRKQYFARLMPQQSG